jgi:hypothetical protein
MYDELIAIIIGIIIGAIIIFLILREFFCWYWKINRLVALMEEQNYLLSEITKKSFSPPQKNISSFGNKPVIENNNSTVSRPVVKNDNLEETANKSSNFSNGRRAVTDTRIA